MKSKTRFFFFFTPTYSTEYTKKKEKMINEHSKQDSYIHKYLLRSKSSKLYVRSSHALQIIISAPPHVKAIPSKQSLIYQLFHLFKY
jgi:hypothetical protein